MRTIAVAFAALVLAATHAAGAPTVYRGPLADPFFQIDCAPGQFPQRPGTVGTFYLEKP